MTAVVESARQDWGSGHRRFVQETRDRESTDRLHRELDLVLDGLRRRVGSIFTLAELADAYGEAEPWVRQAFEEQAEQGWAATLTIVQDAAFHLYSRSALDYQP